MKKTMQCIIAAVLLFGGLAGCTTPTTSASSESSESAYTGAYTVKITAIGSTSIAAGKTVQLRSSVTGTTDKNVTWKSSDPTIASVNASGLVTGLSEGTVTVTASLDIEPACKGEIAITVTEAVVPSSISITGADEALRWVGDVLSLKIATDPSDASPLVTWSSSDASVATVSSAGEVEFLSEGSVTISASSLADPSVTASKTFTVKYGMFSSVMGSAMWDISNQADDSYPHVAISAENSGGYNSLYYHHVKAERYYAEAYFRVSGLTSDTWDWQGIGLGHGLNDSDTRFFTFSPHSPVNTANSFNKCIVRDMPTTWGALTNRSQIWGENGLDYIDCFEEGVKIATLRDGNLYYYLINDEVFYVDETTKYNGIPTYPVLVSESLPCTVSEYRIIDDEAILDTMLKSAQYTKTFYASNVNIVDYDDDSRIVFNSSAYSNKDNKVKYLGDKGKVVRNFEIEMDVKNLAFNSGRIGQNFVGLTINLSRYEAADSVESLMIGRSKTSDGIVARYLSWTYAYAMEDDACIVKENLTTAPVISDPSQTTHIKVTRTIDENNKSNFAMFINGEEVAFDETSIALQERYTAAYLLWIGAEYATCEIENFTLRSNIE